MGTFPILLTLALDAASAIAQDPGIQAAQQATQAAQQANDQAIRDAQLATQSAHQQSMQNTQCYRCSAATPKFSVKPGTYSSAVTVKIRDASRGAVIYYTTDGWTPTAASTRYTGPITIDSTTSLQAIAISPYGGRSRVATAVYTLNGVPPTPAAPQSGPVGPNPAAAASASAKVLLAKGTAVPLVFASDVNSKTADVGDKIPLTLAQDLKAWGLGTAKRGTPPV